MPRARVHLRPVDYVATGERSDGRRRDTRFGNSPRVEWVMPERGTQKGCAAAQLQHHLAMALRAQMTASDGCQTVGDFCDLHRINHGRIRKILAGHQALPFAELALIVSKLDRGVPLVGVLDTPIDMADHVPMKVVKTWAAPPATRATWDVARVFFAEQVALLIATVTDWKVKIKLTADPDPSHADHPVFGWMEGSRAELDLYLADDWLTRIYNGGYSRRDDRPVIAAEFVDDRPVQFTVLDLVRGDEAYEYYFVQRLVEG